MLIPVTPDDGVVWQRLVMALRAENLPTDDLADPGQVFFRLDGTDAWVGCLLAGEEALLRSALVPAPLRGQQIGRRMVELVLAEIRGRGVKRAWVLTTSAADFARSLGFRPVDRAMAPAAISQTAQFRGLCPASAVLLALDL